MNPTTSWTITDQLGSPRILVNTLGEVISRRDFLPFGEEILPEAANHRTNAALRYNTDGVRQKFTGYQKDEETGLDFAENRMYQNLHGRFTAVDPLLASGQSVNPQTFNRYVYVANNPLLYTDPTGLQMAEEVNEGEEISSSTTWVKQVGMYLHQMNNRLRALIGLEEFAAGSVNPNARYKEVHTSKGIVPKFLEPTEPLGHGLQQFNQTMETVDTVLDWEPTGIYAYQRDSLFSNLRGDDATFAASTGRLSSGR